MRVPPLALIALAALVVASGCGQKASGGSPAFPTVSVSEANATRTISSTGVYDVVISGTLDVVTIAPNQTLRDVVISGSNDDLSIGPSTRVGGAITLTGSHCTVHLPTGSTIPVDDSGSSNQVLFDSAVAIASEVG